MHYQPVVRSTRPDEIHGVEALVRWRGQDGEVLPAQAFVESAVRRGVLPTSGAWGIDQVCAQVARWNADHGEHAPRVAYVNLGAHEVNDPSLPSLLDSACSRHGVQPHQIGLEIVEHDFVHPGLIDRLTVLRTRGHPLAVDDFGTGYSSISRLFDLEVDVAKIDRRFVQGLPDDARRAGFVQAVIAIAASLGLEVVAEGVETPAQQRFLTDIGCTYLQGYLLGPPQAAADLAPWFRA
jgi:EAL domain-containing protein (putative c-di-GMP-specific phosphodiesterase class I)